MIGVRRYLKAKDAASQTVGPYLIKTKDVETQTVVFDFEHITQQEKKAQCAICLNAQVTEFIFPCGHTILCKVINII